jgi:hypothetical protein
MRVITPRNGGAAFGVITNSCYHQQPKPNDIELFNNAVSTSYHYYNTLKSPVVWATTGLTFDYTDAFYLSILKDWF